MADIATFTDLGLLVFRQVIEFVNAERARSGKTYEEIFDEAAQRIDANEAALKADLESAD